MEDEDKLHARHFREREKCRNKSPEQRATRLQVTHCMAWPVSPLNFIRKFKHMHSTKPMCTCIIIVQSQFIY